MFAVAGTVQVLVEFFAPEFPEFGGIGSSGNPALHAQIHHGKADNLPLTAFSNAERIAEILKHEGSPPELSAYDDAGYGFIGPAYGGTDSGNANARTQSKAKTLKFFTDHL